MVDMAHIAGLIAAGLHPTPFGHADIVTTTTHKTLRGPRGGLIFCREDLAKAVDKSVFPGTQGGPLMHVIAAKAVALKLAATDEYREDQRQTIVNAKLLAATMAEKGARVVSGGTDNHLMLVDVTPLGVTGREAEHLLDEIGITVNKNAIPFDKNPPNIASGIRVGTPATTSRGFREPEMRAIGETIVIGHRHSRRSVRAGQAGRARPRPLLALPGPGTPGGLITPGLARPDPGAAPATDAVPRTAWEVRAISTRPAAPCPSGRASGQAIDPPLRLPHEPER